MVERGEYDADVSSFEEMTDSFSFEEARNVCAKCNAYHWKDCSCGIEPGVLLDLYKNGFNLIDTSEDDPSEVMFEEPSDDDPRSWLGKENDHQNLLLEISCFGQYHYIDDEFEARNRYFEWLDKQPDRGANHLYFLWWRKLLDRQRLGGSPPEN